MVLDTLMTGFRFSGYCIFTSKSAGCHLGRADAFPVTGGDGRPRASSSRRCLTNFKNSPCQGCHAFPRGSSGRRTNKSTEHRHYLWVHSSCLRIFIKGPDPLKKEDPSQAGLVYGTSDGAKRLPNGALEICSVSHSQ